METYPAYAATHGPSAPDHLAGEMAMGANTNPHLSWKQWWPADALALPVSFEGFDAMQSYCPQDDVQFSDFSPNQSIGFSPDWPSFSNTQEYPLPPSTSASPRPEQSSTTSESRRGSVSTLPEKRKRKRSTKELVTAKSTGHGSGRKTKSQLTDQERPQESQSCKVQLTETEYGPCPQQATDGHSKRVQERNRVASNKFRVKKREDARRLKADEEDMERTNRDLSSCVADLTLEVYQLKIRLLQHTDCDCSLIQSYIANEANRYIKDLGDENHPSHR
ncbi:hypothetical protein FSOLCH5_006589 [Fusarium solani]|uniref:BZIP domain-containing protein n=1 Tax=Fusarium solani TaxID=169388 RepID=A0A9P9K3S9_FUSSL|nr:uncharacterized protein B0J15DRAFT_92208 [Fusarium solani]KAH7242955.1 hypothetical protein B0J15DRAFT_92208 [Fusarium solani]KAJ3468107.1 hypothetical protein MRS44_002172 [Fusarium solani]KAJ4211648.1 hypothetical protein NW759_012250 [Fusarium solani]